LQSLATKSLSLIYFDGWLLDFVGCGPIFGQVSKSLRQPYFVDDQLYIPLFRVKTVSEQFVGKIFIIKNVL